MRRTDINALGGVRAVDILHANILGTSAWHAGHKAIAGCSQRLKRHRSHCPLGCVVCNDTGVGCQQAKAHAPAHSRADHKPLGGMHASDVYCRQSVSYNAGPSAPHQKLEMAVPHRPELLAAQIMGALLVEYTGGNVGAVDKMVDALPRNHPCLAKDESLFHSALAWRYLLGLDWPTLQAIAAAALPSNALDKVSHPSTWGPRLLGACRLCDFMDTLEFIDNPPHHVPEHMRYPQTCVCGLVCALEMAAAYADPIRVTQAIASMSKRLLTSDMVRVFAKNPQLSPGQKEVFATRILGAVLVQVAIHPKATLAKLCINLPVCLAGHKLEGEFMMDPSFWAAMKQATVHELLAIVRNVLPPGALEATPDGSNWPWQLFQAAGAGCESWEEFVYFLSRYDECFTAVVCCANAECSKVDLDQVGIWRGDVETAAKMISQSVDAIPQEWLLAMFRPDTNI